jgi:hypothetical protein
VLHPERKYAEFSHDGFEADWYHPPRGGRPRARDRSNGSAIISIFGHTRAGRPVVSEPRDRRACSLRNSRKRYPRCTASTIEVAARHQRDCAVTSVLYLRGLLGLPPPADVTLRIQHFSQTSSKRSSCSRPARHKWPAPMRRSPSKSRQAKNRWPASLPRLPDRTRGLRHQRLRHGRLAPRRASRHGRFRRRKPQRGRRAHRSRRPKNRNDHRRRGRRSPCPSTVHRRLGKFPR